MLVVLDFNAVKDANVKGVKDGRNINLSMIVQANRDTMEHALNRFKGNKNVVAIQFIGDYTDLPAFSITEESPPVFYSVPVNALEESVDSIMSLLDPRVYPVFEVPDTYQDLRMVEYFCAKYPNIRVTGGFFYNIQTVRLGYVDPALIPRRVAESRISSTVMGKMNLVTTYMPDDLDELIFFPTKLTGVVTRVKREPKAKVPKAPKEPKVKTPREPKEPKEPKTSKKSVTSLFGVVGSADIF